MGNTNDKFSHTRRNLSWYPCPEYSALDEMFGTLVTSENQTTVQNVTHFLDYCTSRAPTMLPWPCVRTFEQIELQFSLPELGLDGLRKMFARNQTFMIVHTYQLLSPLASQSKAGLKQFGNFPRWIRLVIDEQRWWSLITRFRQCTRQLLYQNVNSDAAVELIHVREKTEHALTTYKFSNAIPAVRATRDMATENTSKHEHEKCKPCRWMVIWSLGDKNLSNEWCTGTCDGVGERRQHWRHHC